MPKNRYLIKFVLLLLSVILLTPGCGSKAAEKAVNEPLSASPITDYGRIINTDASTNNLVNAGWVANDGDTTYFTENYTPDGSVYKIQEGKSPEIFNNQKASQINVAGNYIFMMNTFNYLETFTIRKMKTDGSHPQTICQDSRQRFVVYNDGKWIYYYILENIICQTDKPVPGEEPRIYEYSTLYKMRVDGSSNQKVLSYIHSLRSPYISDGWIYYSCEPPAWAIEQEKLTKINRGFFKIKLDGTGKTKLLDYLPFSGVVKQGDWLFYSSEGLFKLKIDGSENIKLCDDHAASINVKDDWVYFTSFDDQISLNRIDQEGKNQQKLSQIDRVQDISISGDWIYFYAYLGENRDSLHLYRIKPDGAGEEMLK
jgi:hypothetical protein